MSGGRDEGQDELSNRSRSFVGKLTHAGVRAALAKPGRHRDEGGLMLYVRKPGQASWVVRLQQGGKRRDYGLDSIEIVSLAEARERARAYRKALLEVGTPWHSPGRQRL